MSCNERASALVGNGREGDLVHRDTGIDDMDKTTPRQALEALIDEEAEESFPASDPPSFSGLHVGTPTPEPEPPAHAASDDDSHDGETDAGDDDPAAKRWPRAIPKE